jgi:hypothetical protein
MIKGGVSRTGAITELTMSIGGGKTCTRVYADVVQSGIERFAIIAAMLKNEHDVPLFMRTAAMLLQWSPIELLPGITAYQHKFNAQRMDAYVRQLLESRDIVGVARVLNLDSMLYAIEIASDHACPIDISEPSHLKVVAPKGAVALPASAQLEHTTKSLAGNLQLLAAFMRANKAALGRVYDGIVQTAKQHLRK